VRDLKLNFLTILKKISFSKFYQNLLAHAKKDIFDVFLQ